MATEEDRSLGSAMPLPMWMRGRGRLHDKLDFEQSAFSPPENDDSFLYIRYPPSQQSATNNEATITVADKGTTIKVDISKHTEPCKESILGTTAQSQVSSVDGKLKSAGTNDLLGGDSCGTSVIKVASQMVSGKVVKGFDTFEDEEKEHMKAMGFDPRLRRGSRSLPASPLQSPNASPKSKRKQHTGGGHKYFTSAYMDDKKPGSILANLLASRDSALSQSVTSIAEEQFSAVESSSSTKNLKTMTPPVAKPSHLREMNFWSPTSM